MMSDEPRGYGHRTVLLSAGPPVRTEAASGSALRSYTRRVIRSDWRCATDSSCAAHLPCCAARNNASRMSGVAEDSQRPEPGELPDHRQRLLLSAAGQEVTGPQRRSLVRGAQR